MAAKKKRRARGTGTIFHDSRRGVWVGRRKVNDKLVERSDPNQAVMLAKLARALPPPADATTVREWCSRWLEEMTCRPRTRRLRTVAVNNYFVPALGHLKVALLTTPHVERAAKSWAASLKSANSRRSFLAALHTCLQAAVKEGLRSDNPVKLAAKPRSQKTAVDIFDRAELARIVEAATAAPNLRVFALLAATGCRIGEALALDAADFDPATGTVHITKTVGLARGELGPPKSENGVRRIRVSAPGLPAVRDAHAGRKSGPLFPTADGTRGTYSVARKAWGRLLKRLGLRPRTMHTLRHSFASHALANGYGIPDVAKHLGDDPVTVMRTYAKATGADVAACMDGLAAVSPPNPTASGRASLAPSSAARTRPAPNLTT